MRPCFMFLLWYAYVQIENTSSTEPDIADFKRFVEHVVLCKKVVGLGITLVYENEVVYTDAFGKSDIEKNISVTTDSKFAIGSLTKAFTSAVIAKVLSDNPRYTWDTPIKTILGDDFRLFDDLRTVNVNLRDLLGHKVGIPGYFEPLLVGFPVNTSRESFIRRLQYQQPVVPFRTTFIYSNYFYALAGYVAEKITGKTWEQLVQGYLLDPLHMKNSGFVDHVTSFEDFALVYCYSQQKPVKLMEQLLYTSSPSGPAGSIYSTPNDMGKWMVFHLTHGQDGNGHQIVDNSTLEETYRDQMATGFFGNMFKPEYPISDALVSYNLGWMTSVYRGYKRIWHSGGIVGYSSLLWLFPYKKIGIYATITGSEGNNNKDVLQVIFSRAADMFLGLKPWINKTTSCSYPEPWKNKPEKETAQSKKIPESIWNITTKLEDYEGMFCHPAFGVISIKTNNSELIMRYGRFGKLKMYPITETVFDLRYMDALWFVTNSDGNVKPVRIEFSSDLQSLSYPIDRRYINSTFTKNCNFKTFMSQGSNLATKTNCICIYLILFIVFYQFDFIFFKCII